MEQTLGKRIVSHRKRLGLTQDQLAERLSVTPQAVSKWENDQSCPDITTLPLLAEIFGISTDALLGRERPGSSVSETSQSCDTEQESDGFHFQKGNWEFTYDSSKRTSLSLAVLVLAVGGLLLASRILEWEANFWEILWPTTLLVFGLFGILGKFSFFSLGCLLFGGYYLLLNLDLLPFSITGDLVLPVILVLLGASLLADALKKPKRPKFRFFSNDKQKENGHTAKHDLQIDGACFAYSASFGASSQLIELPRLAHGDISTSFGEYTIDLSGVEKTLDGCTIEANCSFGELSLLVPRKFSVKQNNSTAFAEISTHGHPDPAPAGTINLEASASFGEITVKYI